MARSMDSSNGRARAMPEFRRKRRRGMGFMGSLLSVEKLALNDFVQEGAHPVARRFAPFQNLVEHKFISRTGTQAGGEGDKLACEVSCEQLRSCRECGPVGTDIGDFFV